QDPLAVGRPGGIPAVLVADALEVAPVGVHDEDAAAVTDRAAEGYFLAVGRPRRAAAALRAPGQLLDVTAVGGHDVDVHRAVAVGREGDLFAVGRPGGVRVLGLAPGQIPGRLALGVDREDLRDAGAFADHQQRRPVALEGGGRPRRGRGATEPER